MHAIRHTGEKTFTIIKHGDMETVQLNEITKVIINECFTINNRRKYLTELLSVRYVVNIAVYILVVFKFALYSFSRSFKFSHFKLAHHDKIWCKSFEIEHNKTNRQPLSIVLYIADHNKHFDMFYPLRRLSFNIFPSKIDQNLKFAQYLNSHTWGAQKLVQREFKYN